jgi:hypothetical protein
MILSYYLPYICYTMDGTVERLFVYYYTAIFYPDVHQSFCNIRSNVVIFRLVVADPHKSDANHQSLQAPIVSVHGSKASKAS